MKPVPTFTVPDKKPNGLQWTEDGLFVIDQHSDNIYVMDDEGKVTRTIVTVTENGSGITVGGGYIWTGSNGTTHSRRFRATDTHVPCICKLDYETGALVERVATPDGGGVHGIEWDDDLLWVTAFSPRALILIDPKNGKVHKRHLIDLDVLHGLAKEDSGLWCVDRKAKLVVKYHVETGEEMDRVVFPEDSPDPHGLSIKNGELWYCDAAFPLPRSRDYPEIGKIVR